MVTNHITRSVLLFAWLFAAAISDSLVTHGEEPGEIMFHESYNDALREAKQTRKPIFLEFRCAP